MPSPEFRLAAKACRRSFEPAFDFEVPRKIDWPRFLRLVRRHRIEALAHAGLQASGAPGIILDALQPDSERIVGRNLVLAHECARIGQAFGAARVPVLFLKGLALAAQVYPNPFLKMGWDIDILVARDDLNQASKVLTELGYAPGLPLERVTAWHRRRKESEWQNSDGLVVELHTRLADNPRLLRTLDASSDTVEVPLAGANLPTLGGDALFAYLCVHGTGSAWMRMKWLVDLAALLRDQDEDEVGRLHQSSIALGGGRTAATALLLANEYFGTRLSNRLRRDLESDAAGKVLTSLCRHYLTGRYELEEPTQVRAGTIGIHAIQTLLAPGLRFAAGEIVRQVKEMATRGLDERAEG